VDIACCVLIALFVRSELSLNRFHAEADHIYRIGTDLHKGLVLMALVIAYFVMNHWLQDFPYRMGIGATVFLIAGFGALLIAVLTVRYQSIKVAMADPAKSLRNE
jgi:hypothetical protein